MFDVGNYVIYRNEGVCEVSDIREETFGAVGRSETYYILTPLSSKGATIFVPLNNETLVSYMKPVLSASQINGLAEKLRDSRIDLTCDVREKNNRFKEILSLCDTEELIALVNTLSERIADAEMSGKKPLSTELNSLRRAEKILFDQFSPTTDIASPQDILPLLSGKIKVESKSRT